ncbi:hypothetical protein [Hymenobacter sp. YC55]|uniref:hypothetical protein n=1 Tax=Hymenobacter sp. YC55 TaxID=3034019 RepID=UPI0023F97D3B|nr:hypothetical protein [Hymenobacter sp. YC55]MDF7815268.1 hypothetical protein [Hymenobacter sp. YC55]
MSRTFYFSLLVAGVGAFVSSCSSPQESGTSANAPVAATEAVRGPGTKADSLGGIPGHKFGDPLSAFPGLELTATQKPGTQTYAYPKGTTEPGWFGKRKQESPNDYYSFYVFKDGKFVAFEAMAFEAGRAALQEQALYLFGPGTQTATSTNWEGKEVFAYYSTVMQPGKGPAHVLDVQSQAYVREQATAQADRLKKENAL